MEISADKLKMLLVDPGYIAADSFDAAASEARSRGAYIDELLLEKDLIKDKQLGALVAEYYNVPFVDIKEEKIDEETLSLIPEIVARGRGVIAFARGEGGARVGMRDPLDMEIIGMLEKRFSGPIVRHYISRQGLSEALAHYRQSIHAAFKGLLEHLNNPTLKPEERDSVTVEIVDMLLRYGHESKASDIHVEPHAKSTVIRFRIDGVMHDVLELPKKVLDPVLTRVKILARMRTDEHRAAQDGKLAFDANGEKVDVRVSIVPVTEGENVVMRLLSAKSRQYNLSDLGLSDIDRAKIEHAVEKPHGMILVTGPTGSGKTTTVYAMLKVLNTRDVHIATIEDPVEYEIEGTSQIQVNTATNLTFAKGLRAIVRQDPDIIMVGEIRDEETADIAVNSAMTGHLVLSTLHANDAATTLPRLLDMKIEPFLVASTVNMIIAQRLIRKICEKCRLSYEFSDEEKRIIETHPHLMRILEPKMQGLRIYKGKGCQVCANTGFLGRIGVFEVLEMSEKIKELVAGRAASSEIMEAARKEGMTTILEDGVAKVLGGVTTLLEVIRATKE